MLSQTVSIGPLIGNEQHVTRLNILSEVTVPPDVMRRAERTCDQTFPLYGRRPGQINHREEVAFESFPANGVRAGIGDDQVRRLAVDYSDENVHSFVTEPAARFAAQREVQIGGEMLRYGLPDAGAEFLKGNGRLYEMIVGTAWRLTYRTAQDPLWCRRRLQPLAFRRPIAAADIEKLDCRTMLPVEVAQGSAKAREKAHLIFRIEAPTDMKLHTAQTDVFAPVGGLKKARQVVQRNAEFPPDTGFLSGQTYPCPHGYASLCCYSLHALQFRETVQEKDHAVGMTDRQVQFIVDFARSTENDCRRAALKRHLQFQSAGYVKPVAQADQRAGDFRMVIALDGIVRLNR